MSPHATQVLKGPHAYAEAPDERARMGRISGWLWMVAAGVGAVGTFLPGAQHRSVVVVLALSALVFLYGLGSVTGAIPWERASMNALAVGMVVTIPIAAAGFLAATWVMVGLKRRLLAAELRQRDIANRDPLTGVGNRRVFDTILKRELATRTQSKRPRRDADGEPFSLLILDLDDFKGINDRYGHQVGDAVLMEAAERAHAILRSTDTLARIGGDEFAVIAPGAHGDGVRRLAEALRAAVGAREPNSEAPTPTTSIGWAVFPEDGEDFETLMHSADEHMLALKREARGVTLDY
jgi:diguanylate cyclase (GGDEF)-like protein